ncbi:hypothetical protein MGI18_20710 [Bacillus sp. OVS6]|nr:hypothetical protein MGI18_20710 [Bacillus sp. OVS6]
MELDNTESGSARLAPTVRRGSVESPGLTFQAETFWPRNWAVELDNGKSGSAPFSCFSYLSTFFAFGLNDLFSAKFDTICFFI